MNLLTICPTYNRPSLFKAMMESFRKNSNHYTTHLIIVLSPNDPCFYDYMDILPGWVDFMLCPGSVTECINAAFLKWNRFDLYHITNDDVIYETPGWDDKFKAPFKSGKSGIVYGNDLFQGENLCTFPVISADIAKTLGWLQLPTLDRYCGDVVWRFIGKHCGCLKYLPDVILRHNWNGQPDIAINTADMKKFADWLMVAHRDVQKVEDVIKDRKIC